jgi:hypothetical protein
MKEENNDDEDEAAKKAETVAAASTAGNAPCPSPLNLSAESGFDNVERSSSVDSALSKVYTI